MLSFDKFESVFTRAKKPWWIVYKGANKGQQIGSNFSTALGEGEAAPSIDDSFNELSSLMQDYGDGIYTVELRGNTKASRGNDIHQVMVGDVQVNQTRAAVAGVGAAVGNPAVGFFQGLDGRYFMEQIAGKTDALHAAQLALLQAEMRVNDLKRQLKESEAGTDIGTKIFGLLEKQPQILDRLLGGDSAPAIGVLTPKRPIPPPMPTVQEDDEDGEAYTPGKIDLNDLVEDCTRIQRALPGRHINDVLYGLANFIESDPAKAEGYLKILLGE